MVDEAEGGVVGCKRKRRRKDKSSAPFCWVLDFGGGMLWGKGSALAKVERGCRHGDWGGPAREE